MSSIDAFNRLKAKSEALDSKEWFVGSISVRLFAKGECGQEYSLSKEDEELIQNAINEQTRALGHVLRKAVQQITSASLKRLAEQAEKEARDVLKTLGK